MTTAVASPSKALENYPTGMFVHVADLPGSRDAASSAVWRAKKDGRLIKVRNGVYFVTGGPTRYGQARPPADAIAAEILAPRGGGPTGFSAARALGLTTQVPATPTWTVVGTPPTAVPGVRISRRNNLQRLKLRPPEIAILELLRGGWETAVDHGWPALVTAIEHALADHTIRWREITEAVKGERSPTLRQNLARLTEDLNASGILA
ncbi:hypothetical protein ACQP2U_43305 (plasmid) [Nocardia sp. CA-084685]|uniref:hypothetical protein n=1 Tax=Nocardia sp. CA-084685 TaxID=3239970 RepID=UPI003D96A1D3